MVYILPDCSYIYIYIYVTGQQSFDACANAGSMPVAFEGSIRHAKVAFNREELRQLRYIVSSAA
jgi:hypothetical protein